MAGQLRLATNINRTELPESPKKGNPSGKSSNCVSLVASPFARSTISSFRMSPDDCPVSLAQQAESPDIIVGILHKLIHVRGWRPRFFVLREGILRYYKVPSLLQFPAGHAPHLPGCCSFSVAFPFVISPCSNLGGLRCPF